MFAETQVSGLDRCAKQNTELSVHFIQLEAEYAAVIEIAVGRVVLSNVGHQHFLLVHELLLEHELELCS